MALPIGLLIVDAELFFRAFLGLVLVTAGLAKALTPQKLASFVEAYGLHGTLAFTVGTFLAGTEIVTGIALWVERSERWALGTSAALFLGFTIATLHSLKRHNALDCNCLGVAFKMRHDHVAAGINLAIAAVCAVDAAQPFSRLPLDANRGGIGAMVTLLCGSLLVILYWTSLFARSVSVSGALQNSRFRA